MAELAAVLGRNGMVTGPSFAGNLCDDEISGLIKEAECADAFDKRSNSFLRDWIDPEAANRDRADQIRPNPRVL